MSKKKKKGGKTSAQVPSNAPPKATALTQAEEEYARGSYAGVRRVLAGADGLGDADRTALAALAEKTQVDPVQLMVGIGAFLAAVLVGFLTLVR